MTSSTQQEFAVDGMSCGGCVRSVTHAISRLPGVQKVDVSLEKRAAMIDYDAAVLDPGAIVAAIAAAGFAAVAR